MSIVLIAVIYWLFGTELGAAIRATGCNPQMASAQGINTSFNKVLALMISNGLVGLCGGIYAQYQGAADVNMGRGAIVIGLAAVIISEVIFGKFCAGKKDCICTYTRSGICGSNPLLHRNCICIMAEDAIRLYETVLSSRGCMFPGSSLYERKIFQENGGLHNELYVRNPEYT